MKLVDNWQIIYGSIYSLKQVKIEILKIYIKNNLANDFIRPFKLLLRAFIFFDKKSDASLRLSVDYQSFNKLTINNWYSLPLISKSLDQFGQTWYSILFNLTHAYHRIQIRERNEWKTTFRTRYSHFKYQIMFSRLTNILAMFYGYINKILAEKLNVFVIIYLDNIFILIKNKRKKYVKAIW